MLYLIGLLVVLIVIGFTFLFVNLPSPKDVRRNDRDLEE